VASTIASDYESWKYLRRAIKWYNAYQQCMACYLFLVSSSRWPASRRCARAQLSLRQPLRRLTARSPHTVASAANGGRGRRQQRA
jgi:hypothetical protein